MKVVVTEEITLKQLQLGDEKFIFECIDKYRDMLQDLDFVKHCQHELDCRTYIEYSIKSPNIMFNVWNTKDNKFCGMVQMNRVDFSNSCCEIGCWSSPECRGKGIMTKSMNKFIEYIFNELHLHRIETRVAVNNNQSIKMCERLGLIKEGIERERLKIQDKYYDVQLFSVINPK